MRTRVFTRIQVPDKSRRPTDFVAICPERTHRETLIERTDRCAKYYQSVECSCSGGVIENNVFCRGDFEQIVEFCMHNRVDRRCQRRSESHFQTQVSVLDQLPLVCS